jgi:hypothetical protein
MISEQQFKISIARQFGDSHATGFPKRRQDQLIFLGAATLYLARQSIDEEKQLNAKLTDWLKEMGAEQAIDHVTLRRYQVDFGFVERDRAGNHYRICHAKLNQLFEAAIFELNPYAIVGQAQAEREIRRQQWQRAQNA